MIKLLKDLSTDTQKLKIKGKKQYVYFYQDSKVASKTRKFIMVVSTIEKTMEEFDKVEQIAGNIVGSFVITKNDQHCFIIDDIRALMGDYQDQYKYYELSFLFIEKPYRNKGYGSAFINTVLPYIIKENNILVTYAGASTIEYKKEPSRRKLYKIIKKVSNFYSKNNFISFNDFSNFENGEAMLYINNTDVLLHLTESYKEINKENKSYINNLSSILDELEKNIGILKEQIYNPKSLESEIMPEEITGLLGKILDIDMPNDIHEEVMELYYKACKLLK